MNGIGRGIAAGAAAVGAGAAALATGFISMVMPGNRSDRTDTAMPGTDLTVQHHSASLAPGHVLDEHGKDTGILVNPVIDEKGAIVDWVPASEADSQRLGDLTGFDIAPSSEPVMLNEKIGDGSISGRSERVPRNAGDEQRRSIGRQNETGPVLAGDLGMDIERLPNDPRGKSPDFKDTKTGETIDCYSPSTLRASTIAKEAATKIDKGQADVVVVNLADTTVTPEELGRELDLRPSTGQRCNLCG